MAQRTEPCGDNGVLYGIDASGQLFWHLHQGFLDGVETVDGTVLIAKGWDRFTKVWAGQAGVLYGTDRAGHLYWHRHLGYRDGARVWSAEKRVSFGWDRYRLLLGADYGVTLAVE